MEKAGPWNPDWKIVGNSNRQIDKIEPDRRREPRIQCAGATSWHLAGIGWGKYARTDHSDDLAGRLKRLDLPDARGGLYSLEGFYRTGRPPPARAWMTQRFADQAGNPKIYAAARSPRASAVGRTWAR
jgi:hypothetical protein